MKIAHLAQSLSHARREAPSQEVLSARQSFRQTKKFLGKAVDKLHEQISQQDLTRQQRVQIREAFKHFNSTVHDVSQTFRQSSAVNPGQYQAELAAAGQDLNAVVQDILAQREEAITAPGSKGSGGRLGGPGINLLA